MTGGKIDVSITGVFWNVLASAGRIAFQRIFRSVFWSALWSVFMALFMAVFHGVSSQDSLADKVSVTLIRAATNTCSTSVAVLQLAFEDFDQSIVPHSSVCVHSHASRFGHDQHVGTGLKQNTDAGCVWDGWFLHE